MPSDTEHHHAGPAVPARGTQELFPKLGTEPTVALSSFRGRAVRKRPMTLNGVWGAFVCVFFLAQSTTRWAQGARPRSKQQVGFEREDQDLVSALAASKNASCCRCAKRRAGIREHSQKHREWSSVPLSSVPDATIAESLLNSIGNSFPS
jgi:hypothetical protein